ncbi:hypothetical protein [Endothiovibrio diazotrophicus]
MRPRYQRHTEILRLRKRLMLRDVPRLKMSLIVGLTGAMGFLASFVMLRCCVLSMAVRYPAAIAVAYVLFLILLWLWLRSSAEDYTGFSDAPTGPLPCRGSSAHCAEAPSATFDDGGAAAEAPGAIAAAGEFAIPLAVLMIVGALLFSSLWIVYTAPTLFAELLVDGALSASLYRRLRGLETRHWLTTAVMRTFWPFAVTALVSSLGGMVLQHYAPAAHSLGEALRSLH